MEREIPRKPSFLLRLPISVWEEATRIAHQDGTSLNHFISIAVAEKISRMEHNSLLAAGAHTPPETMIHKSH